MHWNCHLKFWMGHLMGSAVRKATGNLHLEIVAVESTEKQKNQRKSEKVDEVETIAGKMKGVDPGLLCFLTLPGLWRSQVDVSLPIWCSCQEPLRPPCPKYRPMELSEWVAVPGGVSWRFFQSSRCVCFVWDLHENTCNMFCLNPCSQFAGYQMQASLPGVKPSDWRAQLSRDGQNIEILGYRQASSLILEH